MVTPSLAEILVDSLDLEQGFSGTKRRVDIALALRPGDVAVVWGAAATGKSQLGRHIARLAAPGPRAIIPTNPYLAFDGVFKTVAGELRSARGERKIIDLDRHARAFGLDGLRDRDVWVLSGGEAVRLALAKAALASPRLIVLDDVLSALDGDGIETTLALARRLADDGAAVVILQTPGTAVTEAVRKVANTEHWLAGPLATDANISPLLDHVAGFGPIPRLEGLLFEGVQYGYGRAKPYFLERLDLQSGLGYAVTGPNGAGKTTLLKMIAGAMDAAGGRILARRDGSERCVSLNWERQTLTALQTQEPEYQFAQATVRAELQACQPRQSRALRRRQAGLVEQAIGAGLADLNPFGLPRSHQRLLSSILAVLSGRPVILLDEPTQGLDEAQRALLSKVLFAAKSSGRIVVAVTHDRPFADQIADEFVPPPTQQP